MGGGWPAPKKETEKVLLERHKGNVLAEAKGRRSNEQAFSIFQIPFKVSPEGKRETKEK